MTGTYRSTIIACIIGLIAAAIIFSCATPPPKKEIHSLKKQSQPKINITSLEKLIHTLVNKERKAYHLTELAWDDVLSTIARSHSRDMAKRNYFAHESPEGHDFSYRYKEHMYDCAVRGGSTIYLGAENILQNNLYDSVTYVNKDAFYDWNSHEKIAETTVQGWMKSPGHRKNILMPLWRKEGIGVVIAPDDKVYITQNFC